jgi:hypothetical protein
MGEKRDDLRAANGSGKQPEVKIPKVDSGDHRKGLPGEVILQHRRLSFGGPDARAVRTLAQSTFVGEDDGSPFFLCYS